MARRAGTLAPVLEECVEFRLRRLTGDAVFQSPHDMDDVEAAVLTPSGYGIRCRAAGKFAASGGTGSDRDQSSVVREGPRRLKR